MRVDRVVDDAEDSIVVSVDFGRVEAPLEHGDDLGGSLVVKLDVAVVQAHGNHIYERIVAQTQVLHTFVGICDL